MELKYRISLWNYFHYHAVGSLERVVDQIRKAGYGVEIWPNWFEEQNLFDPIFRPRLRALLSDMESSIHGGGPDTFDNHKMQIDTAAETGSDVVVVHSGHMRLGENPDFAFAQEVVDYARERDVTIALENGALPVLKRALENVEGLKICLDVGHVYFTPDPMKSFVDSLRKHICHLHIQDTLGEMDHYVPGTGIIPREDWRYLFRCLDEEGFSGAAVLEIRPRTPLQDAELTKRFFDDLFEAM